MTKDIGHYLSTDSKAFLGADKGAMITAQAAITACATGNVAWILAQLITAPVPIIDLIVFFGGRALTDAICAYWVCLADDSCSDFLRAGMKKKFLSGGISDDFMSGSYSVGMQMTDEERSTDTADIIIESLAEASAATLPNVKPGPPQADAIDGNTGSDNGDGSDNGSDNGDGSDNGSDNGSYTDTTPHGDVVKPVEVKKTGEDTPTQPESPSNTGLIVGSLLAIGAAVGIAVLVAKNMNKREANQA